MSEQRDFEEFDLRPALRTVVRSRIAILGTGLAIAVLAVAAVTVAAGARTASARFGLVAPNNSASGVIARANPAEEVSRLRSGDLANRVADAMRISRVDLKPIDVQPVEGTNIIDVAVHAPSASVATKTLETYLTLYQADRVASFAEDASVERSMAAQRLKRIQDSLNETEKLLNAGNGTGSIALQTRLATYIGQITDAEQTINGIDQALKTGPVRMLSEPEVDRLSGNPARIPAAVGGLLLGATLAAVAALALELFRNRVRSRRDIVNASPGLVVIGEIARQKRSGSTDLADSPSVLAARTALLRVAEFHDLHTIVCVATAPGSADAEVAALASGIAQGVTLSLAYQPLRSAADARALAAADGAVILVHTGKTRRRSLAGTVEELAAQRITIIGAVLFDLDPSDVGQSIRTYRATARPTTI